MNTEFSEHFEHELLEEISNIPPSEIPKDTVILREQSYIKKTPLVVKGNIKVRKTDESGKEIILGLAIGAAGLYFNSWWGLVGIVPVFTALINWCPLYLPFGIKTCRNS
jgi:CRP-like cAMP-binding protein